MDDLPQLRTTIPVLEPDPVLLGQLVELSAASSAAAARRTLRPGRALTTGAAALGLVAATSWIAGALPGVPSPIAPHQVPAPAPTSTATPSRTADDSVPGASLGPTSGVSRPHAETPGVVPPTRSPGWTPPGKPSAVPTGPGGRAIGLSPSKHPDEGQRLGQDKQDKTRPAKKRGKRHLHSPPASPGTDRPSGRPTMDATTRP